MQTASQLCPLKSPWQLPFVLRTMLTPYQCPGGPSSLAPAYPRTEPRLAPERILTRKQIPGPGRVRTLPCKPSPTILLQTQQLFQPQKTPKIIWMYVSLWTYVQDCLDICCLDVCLSLFGRLSLFPGQKAILAPTVGPMHKHYEFSRPLSLHPKRSGK